MSNDVKEMVKASLYLPGALLDAVRDMAREEDRTQTWMLRRLIEAGIAARRAGQSKKRAV